MINLLEEPMSACVVWIDSENAKIFKISATGIEKKVMHTHTVNPIGARHDSHKHNAEEHFYHEVALAIGQVEELLIFGAGVAKSHF
jgi:stalled ribosome rescue protein Dom34